MQAEIDTVTIVTSRLFNRPLFHCLVTKGPYLQCNEEGTHVSLDLRGDIDFSMLLDVPDSCLVDAIDAWLLECERLYAERVLLDAVVQDLPDTERDCDPN